MPELFESTRINGVEIKNRFVRSATYEALAAQDGSSGDKLVDYMVQVAKGGVGLVIASHAYVTREGQAGPRQLGIYSDAMIDGLKKITASIHENASIVFAQLAHAGKRGIGKGEYSPMGPCEVIEDGEKKVSEMTPEDIQRTVRAFGDAAQRTVQSGFDGVQIHAAHSYLLSQFLSPFYNTREDEFGGSLKNRARFLIQVYEEIRKRVGKTFPVMVKINSEDFVEGGLTVEEMLDVCEMLEKRGLDAVEMSGGTFDSGKLFFSRPGTSKSEDREAYYKEAAAAFKKKVKIPLIIVGGFLSFHIAQEIVASGVADFVALSRPLIREPDLVKRWAAGETGKALCISCNKCFATLFTEEGLNCSAEKKE